MELTERQKEIKGLLQDGKTAKEIASDLNISDNAVYQAIRRMRSGGANVSTPTGRAGRKNGGTKAKRGAKRQAAPAAPKIPEMDLGTIRAITPLQSVRNRRSEIQAEVREAGHAVAEAEGALRAAKSTAERIQARFKDELKSLDQAERALAPKRAATNGGAAKSSKTRSGRSKAKGRARGRTAARAAQGGSQPSSNGGKASETASAGASA
jgi:biotin operon repressor